ncbi:MAG: peptide chain release factor-like protein [Lentisphaeria bacterium]|nr:peptide chain release factor-like protein [Lentisphaeria bacterium]
MSEANQNQYHPDRARLLALSEQQLLAECRCDTMRGTGPGGQKRNKTESAVRVTHVATGLFAFDDVERSQHINRHHALQKLRLEFALHLRCEPTAWKQPVPGPSSDSFPLWAAVALDSLFATDYKLSEAIAILGTTTSQLVKNLAKLPALWQFVNAERTKRNLPTLKLIKN